VPPPPTETTKLGGASAGSLIAACVHSGMSASEITSRCLELMRDLRVGGTRGRLGPVLEAFLKEYLPEDAHERCTGLTHVAVTKAFPVLRPALITDFQSKDDLISCLLTSCHIPLWLDGKAVTTFRGEAHFDGGLTNFIPVPPGTTGVRVSCFPANQLSPVFRIGISPDSFGPWPHKLQQMVAWAFEPADEGTLLWLMDRGAHDARSWMESMELRLPKTTEVEKDARMPLVGAGAGEGGRAA
jgi:hypothetical protein